MTQTLAFTWVNNRLRADTARFRKAGTLAWTTITSFRSREFPSLTGKYLHTALMEGLDHDSIYEVNPVGTDNYDTVKTARATGVKLAAVSDYHRGANAMTEMGAKFTADEVDCVVMVGDLVDDNGVFSETFANYWLTFLADMTTNFRTTAVAQVPVLTTVGNHDGAAPDAGAAGAISGGTGTAGLIKDVFSTGYASEHPSWHGVYGSAAVAIGDVLCLTIDTDHMTAIVDQGDWFADTLAADATSYAHVDVFGHWPAFSTAAFWSYYEAPPRALRRYFWTEMQEYPNVRHYICGHIHALQISKPLTMAYDEEMSVSDNDLRFETGSGIRQIGAGPWGGVRLGMEYVGEDELVSTIDGQGFVEAMLHYDTSEATYLTFGDITNPVDETWHGWLLEFGADEVTATARSRKPGNGDFYQVVDTI